ncbi:acetyl-CoA carboxylase biotin carboxyl carrier protein [Cupriavidus sp. IDO]|uniref:acetyl-CoA carboxylase biotin carboxyl carrier protein n=1 Tax=Cupriavidus sp. IDO TaxID=1539142 RepID=UPI00057921D3|nr:acetyl-CoA carboxylase biotin carboxyl carrier protein subunit [Cupriavidus sp. IDO]KWR88204.1 acetyl-CoA carboxylase biotin carboxyl carrier protein subunit [Cupriavidus sp. IDO]
MDLTHIKQLIDVMASSDMAEMSFSQHGWTLRLTRHISGGASGDPAPPSTLPRTQPRTLGQSSPPSEPVAPVPPKSERRELLAPLFGIVHLRPAPDEPAFVQPGQTVEAGQTVCVIEAMKVFNAVVAERDGAVESVLVESGKEVEAGQPLIRFA